MNKRNMCFRGGVAVIAVAIIAISVVPTVALGTGVPENIGFNVAPGIPGDPNVELPCGGFTNINGVAHVWTPVEDAIYQRQWMVPGTDSWVTSQEFWTTPYMSEFRHFGSSNGIEGMWSARVRAIDSDDVAGAWSDVCYLTYDITAPDAPELTFPENGAVIPLGERKITFIWENGADEGIQYYKMKFDGKELDVYLTRSQFTQKVSKGDHTWQVMGVDWAGNASEWSKKSNFTVKRPASPVQPKPPVIQSVDPVEENIPEQSESSDETETYAETSSDEYTEVTDEGDVAGAAADSTAGPADANLPKSGTALVAAVVGLIGAAYTVYRK